MSHFDKHVPLLLTYRSHFWQGYPTFVKYWGSWLSFLVVFLSSIENFFIMILNKKYPQHMMVVNWIFHVLTVKNIDFWRYATFQSFSTGTADLPHSSLVDYHQRYTGHQGVPTTHFLNILVTQSLFASPFILVTLSLSYLLIIPATKSLSSFVSRFSRHSRFLLTWNGQ